MSPWTRYLYNVQKSIHDKIIPNKFEADTAFRQRAFRERKERHVKELEAKLNTSEQTLSTLHADVDRLKRELARVATENEILRATSHSNSHSRNDSNSPSSPVILADDTPLTFTAPDFYSNVIPGGTDQVPIHRMTVSEKTGEKMLGAGATWDLIQAHPLYKKGLVEVGDVCERLRACARCDGQGPVFEERDVRRAVEESVAGGSDELI